MRTRFRLLALVVAGSIVAPNSSRATPPPPQFESACYSINILPCTGCPGIRSKFCIADPAGLFVSCSETQSSCDGTHSCSDVTTTTGPACGG